MNNKLLQNWTTFFRPTCYSNIAILAIIFLFTHPIFAQPQRHEFTRNLMGSPFRLVLYTDSEQTAKNVADSVFNYIGYLNEVMSDYRDGSEINRLSAQSGSGKWIVVSPPLFGIIQQSLKLSEVTNGSFDITVGPALKLWRLHFLKRTFPNRKELKQSQKRIGYKYIKIDSSRSAVKLKRKKMRLDVGGIGKGYAADEGVRIATQLGIKSLLLDAGGDLVVTNPPPSKSGWDIEISSGTDKNQSKVMQLSNCGVATSGATYRYLEHAGKRYSHIVNPKTGVGLLHHIRSTVVAPNGTLSDALATSISVLGVEKSKKMLTKFPEVKVWLIEEKEGNINELNTL